MSHPQVVPWKSNEELSTLMNLFFSPSDDDKAKAVRKVKAYLTRGKLLHSIESTCVLTSIQLNDKPGADALFLRASYSMALIRFVNGLLDPYQKAVHAIPLHGLARKLNLPSSFVEIRHIATHENLPNLSVLRSLAQSALKWLKENFWSENNLENRRKEFKIKSNAVKISAEDYTKYMDKIKDHLRVYRRFHRNGIRVVNQNDATNDPEVKLYWDNLNAIFQFLNRSDHNTQQLYMVLLDVLCFKNVLITKKKDIKFSQLRVLYTPLLEYLNTLQRKKTLLVSNGKSFYYILFKYLISKQEDYYAAKKVPESRSGTQFNFASEIEIKISTKWLEFLLVDKSQKLLVPIEDALELIETHPDNSQNLQLLNAAKAKIPSITLTNTKKLDTLIHLMSLKLSTLESDIGVDSIILNQPANRDTESKVLKREHDGDNTNRKSLDDGDITADLESLKKRLKLSHSNSSNLKDNGNTKQRSAKKNYLFWELAEYYEPTPFGVPI